MNKKWDGTLVAHDPAAWAEVYRVLKPGGFLLAFSATRTYHRMAVAIEDAGFEIRDQIMWVYGSGMPKGLNVSKAIDKAAGAEREVIAEGKPVKRMIPGADQNKTGSWIKDNGREFVPTETAPATDAAKQWDGWNSAIKPACEPVCVARKPFKGTIVNNVLAHGTGAYHVDACRIGTDLITAHGGGINEEGRTYGGGKGMPAIEAGSNPHIGRWPANVILDSESAAALDAMSGERKAGSPKSGAEPHAAAFSGNLYGDAAATGQAWCGFGDTGGASRFFYTSKSSQAERNIGHAPGERCNHPTVKPIDLMQWLVRLVTPPQGIVLDPFMGSGSTGVACSREGFQFIGIDLDEHNVETARKRIVGDAPLFARVAD